MLTKIQNGIEVECSAEESLAIEEERKATQTANLDFLQKEYQRSRLLEYPSVGDQLDSLFHAGVFPPQMANQIQAIKDKYPKGGEQ